MKPAVPEIEIPQRNMASILIIGWGNSLRSDDGVGWHLAQELLRVIDSPNVEIISCGQLTPDLAEPISRAWHVIFLDAGSQGPAGEPKWERVVPQPAAGDFSHQLSPPALLAIARDLYSFSPQATLISIPGASFAFGESLSPTVTACVPGLLARIQEMVAQSTA